MNHFYAYPQYLGACLWSVGGGLKDKKAKKQTFLFFASA